jgi:serine/threonine-protein kinase
MGEVVLAERADGQFRQQVAIKLLRRGAVSRQLQARLKVERQILAALEHPYIAKLLDGGSTTVGTPYIVMEYVNGLPIDIYCDSHHLIIEGRLRLFQKVCSAVQCAHQNLVVHRDLKPSNILVTADGTPKLLDFGIAKMLDEQPILETMAVTHFESRMLTPDHASPEQVRGEPVTTASDIYVLGVLLYELLTGRRPFVFKGNHLGELARAICELPPIPLDTGLSLKSGQYSKESLQLVCADRSTTSGRLRRAFKGDLNNIVMMALRKEPDRRYSSVEQLNADIERYLENMPVSARADTFAYRAHKFIHRHTLGVSAATLAAMVFFGFTILSLMQAQRVAKERERAEEVSGFMVNMFEHVDPTHARGHEITVREVLDEGTRRIAVDLAKQPDIQSKIMTTMGSVYGSLGLYPQAERLFSDALTSARNLHGAGHIDVVEANKRLGDVLLNKGDYAASEQHLQTALSGYRGLRGARSQEVAATLHSLARLRKEQERFAEARSLYVNSMVIMTTQAKTAYAELASMFDDFAALENYMGNYADAIVLYRRALELSRSKLGPDHPQVAQYEGNLAKALDVHGQTGEADALFRHAMLVYRQTFGLEHPETIASLTNFGDFLRRKRDFVGSQDALTQALDLERKTRGENHPYVGYDHVNLGLLYLDMEKWAEAEAQFQAALTIYNKTLPGNHFYIASARRFLGEALLGADRAVEAELELRRALNTLESALPSDNPRVAATRASLGWALVRQRRYSDAEPLLLGSYPLLVHARGPSDSSTTQLHSRIQQFFRDDGRPQDADAFFASVDTQAAASRER